MPSGKRPGQIDVEGVFTSIAALMEAASHFVSKGRIDDLLRAWLVAPPGGDLDDDGLWAVASAMAHAAQVAMFTPSVSGSTAFDRLAKQCRGLDAAGEVALRAIRQSSIRLLQVEGTAGSGGEARLRDLVAGEVFHVSDRVLAGYPGLRLITWLGPLGDGRHVLVTDPVPLDEDGLALVQRFVQPGKGGALPLRCAEAVFRHVARHGATIVPGINDRPAAVADDVELSELTEIGLAWSQAAPPRDMEDVACVREWCGLDDVFDTVATVMRAREATMPSVAAAFLEILVIQLETLLLRGATGSVLLDLERAASALDEAIAQRKIQAGARDVFREARRLIPTTIGGMNPESERLVQRIRGLRAKTVEQGCTEQEAIAAAAKVAELLDRYGLSLSTLELQRMACVGGAVESSRKRTGPIDECVPGIAGFFDCRVWGEKAADGTVRHVFFGLPPDVAGARYLYSLVEQAFETEGAAYRASQAYQALPPGVRRTGTNSFAIGLARGITRKLHDIRDAREGALRSASGRDLVVAKAEAVDDGMARLGLHLRQRKRSNRRRVIPAAFESGRKAGLGFQYTPGLG